MRSFFSTRTTQSSNTQSTETQSTCVLFDVSPSTWGLHQRSGWALNTRPCYFNIAHHIASQAGIQTVIAFDSDVDNAAPLSELTIDRIKEHGGTDTGAAIQVALQRYQPYKIVVITDGDIHLKSEKVNLNKVKLHFNDMAIKPAVFFILLNPQATSLNNYNEFLQQVPPVLLRTPQQIPNIVTQLRSFLNKPTHPVKLYYNNRLISQFNYSSSTPYLKKIPATISKAQVDHHTIRPSTSLTPAQLITLYTCSNNVNEQQQLLKQLQLNALRAQWTTTQLKHKTARELKHVTRNESTGKQQSSGSSRIKSNTQRHAVSASPLSTLAIDLILNIYGCLEPQDRMAMGNSHKEALFYKAACIALTENETAIGEYLGRHQQSFLSRHHSKLFINLLNWVPLTQDQTQLLVCMWRVKTEEARIKIQQRLEAFWNSNDQTCSFMSSNTLTRSSHRPLQDYTMNCSAQTPALGQGFTQYVPTRTPDTSFHDTVDSPHHEHETCTVCCTM